MHSIHWSANKKRKTPSPSILPPKMTQGNDDEEEGLPFPFPFKLPNIGGGSTIYTSANHIYFNDDIDDTSAFALNKELRALENKLLHSSINFGVKPDALPIYLHITTLGGSIHSAFSIIDCMNGLKVPVYTVCDGLVASAGTIISISGKKRYMQPNSYLLIHQLSSNVWGKMAEIDDEYDNLKKLMAHIIKHYMKHTNISRKALEAQLKHDATWDVNECISRGMVDEIYVN
jgi:ATP-dependent Clp endopeptidase proteolytic subunit ClpP